MFRLLRIIVNSFALMLLAILAYVMWQSNPTYSVVLALATIDQFEDVYYYVYRKRLFPQWFMPFDMVFEMVLFGVGLGMLIFSISYFVYFETWFFKALLPISILIMYSSIEDILMWRAPEAATEVKPETKPLPKPEMVMAYVCPKEKEIREKEGFRFVRRKH